MEGGREGPNDPPNDSVTGPILLPITRSDLDAKREEMLSETADEYTKLQEILIQ